jgi:putative tricarboxylic transport membrane protein
MHKFNLRNGDVVSGGLLAALGTYIVIQASIWPYYGFDGPGPGFFPLWYGILMIGLSLWLIVSTALKPKPEHEKRDFTGTRRALIVWAAFAACLALMGVIGFSISFALFTIFVVTYVFQRSIMTAVLTGAASSLVFYVTFYMVLGVQLPTGLVGF